MKTIPRSLNSRFAIGVLSFALFLAYVTANAPTPLYMLWQQKIHYSATGISVIFIVYHLGIAMSLLSLSRVSQPAKVKKLLLAALIGTMLAACLFAHTQAFWQLVGARIIIGLCCGTFVSCGITLIINIGLRQNVQNTPLLVTLSCVLGFGLGPFFAGILADSFSSPGYWIFGPLIAALLLCLLALLPLKAAPNIAAAHNANQRTSEPQPRNIKLACVAVAVFASPFALSGLFISLGPNMIAGLMNNHSRTVAGAIPLLLFGCGTLAQLSLNRLALGKLIVIGVLTTLAGSALIILAESYHSVLLMTLAAILAGIGQSMTQLAGTYLIKQYRPMGTLEKSTATFFLGGYLFAASTIFILGWMTTHAGLLIASEIFISLCLILLLCGVGGFILLKRSPHSALH